MSQEGPLQDPFEFLRKMWASMGVPMPGASMPGAPFAGMVAPMLNIADVEKQISDLKSVENWLSINLNMLRMSIQGLEMQKATLDAIKAMQTSAAGAASAPGANPLQSAAEAWWSPLQQGLSGDPGSKQDK